MLMPELPSPLELFDEIELLDRELELLDRELESLGASPALELLLLELLLLELKLELPGGLELIGLLELGSIRLKPPLPSSEEEEDDDNDEDGGGDVGMHAPMTCRRASAERARVIPCGRGAAES